MKEVHARRVCGAPEEVEPRRIDRSRQARRHQPDPGLSTAEVAPQAHKPDVRLRLDVDTGTAVLSDYGLGIAAATNILQSVGSRLIVSAEPEELLLSFAMRLPEKGEEAPPA